MKFIVDAVNPLAVLGGAVQPLMWKSLVLLGLVFVGTALWRRGTAAGRHLAWTVSFFCLLCLPVLAPCLPAWRAPAWLPLSSQAGGPPDSFELALNAAGPPASRTTVPVEVPAAAASATQNIIVSNPHTVVPALNWRGILTITWLAGVALGLIRILTAHVQLRRLTRSLTACENPGLLQALAESQRDGAAGRLVRLVIAPTSATPMTWGVWHPVIALPAEASAWPMEQLQAVLRHELAHVRRRDCLTQEIARVACTLYWFNPLVWLAAARMRLEREKACDDFVLNTGSRPVEYARQLVEIAQQFSSAAQWGGAVAMARPSGLERRVEAILDGQRNRHTLRQATAIVIVLAIGGLGLLIAGCANGRTREPWSLKYSPVGAQLRAFIAKKTSQEALLAAADQKDFTSYQDYSPEKYKLPDTRPLFAAAARGDWPGVSNLWSGWSEIFAHPTETNAYPHGSWRQPLSEVSGAFDAFATGDEKYSLVFGRSVLESIPAGSIYFGGTDPGRFIITALQKSDVAGDPFFTLSQNALADGSYIDYLHSLHAKKIYLPNSKVEQKCFEDYIADTRVRFQNHQLEDGEHYVETQGRVSVSGWTAVMKINALLARVIFDKNPDREFYVEESWPMDWMYPRLQPYGFIMKVNREPLARLSDEAVHADQDFWEEQIRPIIGDWVRADTSVAEIAAFDRRVFLKHDYSGFAGDPAFVENVYSHRMYAKLRASIAGLYAWRARNAAYPVEQARMANAADLAFRQALALSPDSPEVIDRYVDFLKAQHLDADAAQVQGLAGLFSKVKGDQPLKTSALHPAT